jgi:hypothetical protein
MLAAATVNLILIVGLCSYMVRQPQCGGFLQNYYVSIGDSYAAGYRPDGAGSGSRRETDLTTRHERPECRSKRLKLANFGCSVRPHMRWLQWGTPGALAPDGIGIAMTAGHRRSRIHRRASRQYRPRLRHGRQRFTALPGQTGLELARLRGGSPYPKLSATSMLCCEASRGGRTRIPIVGISYINVSGGRDERRPGCPGAGQRSRVPLRYLNPALRQMVEVQRHIHRYDRPCVATCRPPKTSTPELGTVTASIGRVCALTYYCSDRDIHPRSSGHASSPAQSKTQSAHEAGTSRSRHHLRGQSHSDARIPPPAGRGRGAHLAAGGWPAAPASASTFSPRAAADRPVPESTDVPSPVTRLADTVDVGLTATALGCAPQAEDRRAGACAQLSRRPLWRYSVRASDRVTPTITASGATQRRQMFCIGFASSASASTPSRCDDLRIAC